MKNKMMTVLACLAITACNNTEKTEESKLMDQTNAYEESISVSPEVLDQMMQTLPSPIEIANIITKSENSFKKELLLPVDKTDNILDKYSQSLELGALGVDLGYLSLNDKTLFSVEYIEAIRSVAKELKVEQFFDFQTLSNLAKNRNNVDSIVKISTKNFNDISAYLREQKRGDLSVLILIGAWLEGLHMYCDIARSTPNKDISIRIGEQKIIVDNIYAILEKLKNIKYYNDLSEKLRPLKDVYATVKIEYEYHEPTSKEVNGQLVIEDNTKTIINLTDEQLVNVEEQVMKLRNNLYNK